MFITHPFRIAVKDVTVSPYIPSEGGWRIQENSPADVRFHTDGRVRTFDTLEELVGAVILSTGETYL